MLARYLIRKIEIEIYVKKCEFPCEVQFYAVNFVVDFPTII